MIADAIDRIIKLAAPNLIEQDGLRYADKPLTLIAPPLDPPVLTATLTGFVDVIGALELAKGLILVTSPTTVSCQAVDADEYGRRQEWARAKYEQEQFRFGAFMPPEDFMIALRTKFVVADSLTDDLDYACRMAGNVASGTMATSMDDGVSQELTVKRGIAMKGVETLKPIVSLTPFRTFPEVKQPTSKFIFRAKQMVQDAPPHLALFEADGGAWRVEAAENIVAWLKAQPSTEGLVTVR